MTIRNEDPDPREDELEGPEPGSEPGEETEVEASEEDEPEVEDPVDGPEDEPEVGELVQPRRPRRTAEESAGDLRRQLRARDDELAQLRAAQRPQQTAPVHQQESPEARRTRLAAMSPEDRLNTIAGENEERLHRTTQLAEFRVAEAEDRATYNELARTDKRAKAYAPQVEAMLLEERKVGRNWPRSTILKFVLGDRVLANQPKAKKQQADADVEARRQSGRPEKPKGDQGSGSKRLTDAQAREKRLLNQRI